MSLIYMAHPPQCRVVGTPQYRVVGAPHCRVVGAPHCRVVGTPHYRVVGAPHYRVVGAPHCRVVGYAFYRKYGDCLLVSKNVRKYPFFSSIGVGLCECPLAEVRMGCFLISDCMSFYFVRDKDSV